MKRALITGITGMDGSHLADFLLEKNYEVYGLERWRSNNNYSNISHILDKIKLLKGDLSDQNSITRCVKACEPHEIYNFAAESFVGTSWTLPEQTSNITGLGVLRVLEAIREVDGQVRDLSYGGLGVSFANAERPRVPNTKEVLLLKLRILDREIEIKAAPVHWLDWGDQSGAAGGVFVGFRLNHESPASLAAMRDLLQPLGWGGTLTAIPLEIRNEHYQGEQWHCLRGDGPTDVMIRQAEDGSEVEEAIVTFPMASGYCDVIMKSGRLATSSASKPGLYGGSQMDVTAAPDEAILRRAIFILASAPSATRAIAKPFTRAMLQALKVDLSAAIPRD